MPLSAAMKEGMIVADDRPLLQSLLNEEAIHLGLKSLPANCFRDFGSEDDVQPEDVVDWILTSLKPGNSLELAGSLPFIERFEQVRGPYEMWLANYAA